MSAAMCVWSSPGPTVKRTLTLIIASSLRCKLSLNISQGRTLIWNVSVNKLHFNDMIFNSNDVVLNVLPVNLML